MIYTNIFKAIKEYLKPQDVAEYYIRDKCKKSGNNIFYKSPFRNEKTASFCVNNTKGFHDYGTGWHGDIISFVTELYNIKPIEAAKLLIKDFSLPIEVNSKVNYKEIKKYRQKNLFNNELKDSLQKWFNNMFIKLCNEKEANDISIKSIKKNLKDLSDINNEDISNSLIYLYNEQNMIEMWLDIFMEATTEKERLELFRQRREVEKIVNG